MSNIEVVERCVEAISSRDRDTLEALSTPDVEVRPVRALLEDTVYRGRAGIDEWMRDVDDVWSELWVEIEESSEPEPGLVVVKAVVHGRGHGSDARTQMPVELVCRLRDGLVTHAETRPRGPATR